MRSAAPPPSPTRPAAELCQECEEPARASVGHGEPPPPPPPRARLPPVRDSELSPHQGRAWLLRQRGMTDPLRRTLSRLQGRRGPRAAGGPGRRVATAATVAASSAAEGDAGGVPAGPLRERAGGARPSLERPPPSPQAWGPEARVPGGRPERSRALGPRPRGGKEAAPSGRGLTRASLHAPPGSEGSVEDEEDDADYYENLPGGSQPAPEPEGAEAERWPPPPPAAGSSPGAEGGRLETGRLQTQLREAYYLLIQAMHDLPPDSGRRQGDRGRADRGCPAGARAPGQPPSPCGAAARRACPRDCERGGGDCPWQQVSPPRSPPRESGGGRPRTPRMRLPCSRSLDSLRVGAKPPPLQRWRSDSWIRCGARGEPDEPPPRGGGMDGWSGGSSRAAAPSGLRPPSSEDPRRSSGSRSKEDGQEGLPFLKPPAVTVKKLQKWMYKGRLLSLGMKGRARRTPPEVTRAQATSPNLGALKMRESQVVSVSPDQRITLTDLFENVYESSMKRRELEDLKDNIGFRGHKPLNSITVSKKRNWLYQSTLRSFNLEDENKKCQDISHLSISPVSLPKLQLSRPFLKSSEEYCTYMVCTATNSSLSRDCSLDFNEENDADDEGEIWYNPIPEDDDFGISNALSFGEADSAVLKFPDVGLRVLSGSDLMKEEQHTEDLLCSSEHTGDVQTTQSNEINPIDSIYSTEFVEQYKQRHGHKTQEGIIVEESPTLKSPFAGPGIVAATNKPDLGVAGPSSPSPSPVKKGSSIHWSFPDKIKSPRTVRKLSMRMKRLPEFSRKLSVKGNLNYGNSPDNTPSLSKCNWQEIHNAVILPSGNTTTAAKRNVISRYHLDTSVSSQHSYQKKTSVVGLYRLCGSAAVKKELREAFERDSKAVGLCESQYPDINVITGVLKDYLRELPSPLITKQLYEAVLDAMAKHPLKMSSNGCENDPSDSKYTVDLLDCLPDVEKATLMMLLDHLKLVASYRDVNKMTCQNLAVCFGPVLLSQRQETSSHNNRVFTDSEELASALDFKKHIEVLHYLLQLWPVQRLTIKESANNLFPEQKSSLNYLRRKKERPYLLNLSGTDSSRVLRPRQTRLDSPLSNRYAGDWSSCGDNYFLNMKENLNDVDYDDVPSEDRENGENCSKMYEPDIMIEQPTPTSKECTFQTYLTMQAIESRDRKVNLKDLQESIDTLIGNLERELKKNKLNMSV
ncbi:rho GTPase-activating protein SYDE2 isoform X3 [Tursiops truncatus]|uniref:Rho GTPase-activating protein SYDE2 isoform X3 n=1 Tax=Tursiops truncatus TaxID=9739 RepID=A0A2U4A3Q0_TURTR|nr:rho GTPase-activating protein SYDE2 isoform X3 [Tursiops truncatus]